MFLNLRHILLNMSQNYRHTVRAAALTGLSSLCRSYGVDAGGVLRQAGLPTNAEALPDRRVPVTAVNLAFELAALATGCNDFGLRLTQLRGLANLGPIGLIARDEPTIGSALSAIAAYLPLHNDALHVSLERFGEIVVLRSLVQAPGPTTQVNDIALAMQVRILRQLAGPDWEAEEVHLTRSSPDDLTQFRKVLGQRLTFDAEFDGIVVRADLLDQPNLLAEPAYRPYAAQWLRMADPGMQKSMVERVRRVLGMLLSSGRCTAAYVAAGLGVSRRTLTRALAAEGTQFLTLLNEARGEVACRHLAGQSRALGGIADLLGFSNPASFSTWFRARFGVSPSEWRRAVQLRSEAESEHSI